MHVSGETGSGGHYGRLYGGSALPHQRDRGLTVGVGCMQVGIGDSTALKETPAALPAATAHRFPLEPRRGQDRDDPTVHVLHRRDGLRVVCGNVFGRHTWIVDKAHDYAVALTGPGVCAAPTRAAQRTHHTWWAANIHPRESAAAAAAFIDGKCASPRSFSRWT